MNLKPEQSNIFSKLMEERYRQHATIITTNLLWGAPHNENALVLATARRLIRPAGSPALGTIRSLAYFLPVIEEVLSLRIDPDYFRYLRHKIERAGQAR